MLATTGRRTGISRRTCLNLQANPSGGVQAGGRRFTAARARVASPAERELLWRQMARVLPPYDEYAQKTDRGIPIVLLTPQDCPRLKEPYGHIVTGRLRVSPPRLR
ncbi:nitroreductase/quinone reductase family protein [Streptomyces sp. NPDC020747]|uniref:nitroreductase/quinone reductase family protein n=1 Tax=Streptomyces sp. NPDC020747 TaxID=3365086 RepID=UPI0037A5A6CE